MPSVDESGRSSAGSATSCPSVVDLGGNDDDLEPRGDHTLLCSNSAASVVSLENEDADFQVSAGDAAEWGEDE